MAVEKVCEKYWCSVCGNEVAVTKVGGGTLISCGREVKVSSGTLVCCGEDMEKIE